MNDSVKDQLAADLEKAKTEGGSRAARIRDIVKAAASEAIVEVKAGSKELGSIAKNSFTTVAANLNTASEKAASETSAPESSASENPAPDFAGEPVGQKANQTFEQQADRYKTLILSFLKLLQERLGNLDLRLNQRYGDRYQAAKQKLEQSANWYSAKLDEAKATPMEPTLLEQKQIELTAQAGAAGTIAAQKEQQIKQQIKEMIQTAAQK